MDWLSFGAASHRCLPALLPDKFICTGTHCGGDLFSFSPQLPFPGISAGKESACNAGDPSLILGSGRAAGEGIGYPLRYFGASLVAQLVKESTYNVGDLGAIPGLRRYPGEGKGYPL